MESQLRLRLFCIILIIPFFFFFNEVRGECLVQHKSLLLELKRSLVIQESYLSGKSSKFANWVSSTDCCLWTGVTCSGTYVTGLDLSDEGIVGGLIDSSPLFDLTSLVSLNLSRIYQRTVIPSGIGRLVNLMKLDMYWSEFSGQIPIEISNLTRLVFLDFTFCNLKVENPNLRTLFGNLSNLIDLRLRGIDLSSQSREWCQALSSSTPRLQVLDLYYCRLSGSIHDSLQKLTHLSEVDISVNNFSGPFPYGVFAGLESLTSLTIWRSGFNGVFPQTMLQLPTLRFLDISSNTLLEPNPSITFQNSSLETLILYGTTFSKTIPESIGEAKMLSYLELGNCNLSGQIPKSISQLEHLVHLHLSDNNLDGHIPSFSRSRNLTVLDLAHNRLSGYILATDWKKLPRMEKLTLWSNSLSGSIPTSLFEMPSLLDLILSANHFTGFTNGTDVRASLSNLGFLDLSGNDLHGPFPPFIYGLHSLWRLDLSFNNFSDDTFHIGSLIQLGILSLASCNLKKFPPSLTNTSTLIRLDLSDNQIDGHIPDQFWNMSDLRTLDLSGNQLDGHIPDQIWNMMSAINFLDLSYNQLDGHVPDQMWNMSVLQYLNLSHNQLEFFGREELSVHLEILDLSSNKLHGSIPKSFCNTTHLKIMDLSNNFLSGTLPQCLFQLPGLSVLKLRMNNINGIIPDTLSSSCVLERLDLSQNSFEGKIPMSMGGCRAMEVLDLGYNKLHDTFPCWISNLDRLSVLVLRANLLHGSLECLNHEFNMSVLQIVDIASNRFGGNLPSQGLLSWEGMRVNKGSTSEMGLRYLRYDSNHAGIAVIDSVLVTVKGIQQNLTRISYIYTLVDFSDNKFEGEIPHEFGELTLLYALNLSHNHLSGKIPPSFGKLYRIESLDLSKNELSGKIPGQLASLNFLSALNLSFNHLEGMIPMGGQFQTFTEASFIGNEGMCGQPLNTSCSIENVAPNPSFEADEKLGDGFGVRYIIISTEVGYALGLGLVIMPLLFWSTWRRRYYKCVDKVLGSICCCQPKRTRR